MNLLDDIKATFL